MELLYFLLLLLLLLMMMMMMIMTTHPLLAPRLRMSRAIPLLPLYALGGLL
jgi:hypothetical protein